MNKKVLTIVKSPQNDKGSLSYLSQIERVHGSQFADKIDLQIVHCENQYDVNALSFTTEKQSDAILILDPTDFKLLGFDEALNAERNQTVDVLEDFIVNAFPSVEDTRILILGKGKGVGRPLLDKLLDEHGYMVTPCGSKPVLKFGEIREYDVIVNAVDCKVKLDPMFCLPNQLILDVAGTWLAKSGMIFSRGFIGMETTQMMLQDVLLMGGVKCESI